MRTYMLRTIVSVSLLFWSLCVFSQEKSVGKFLSDTSLVHASVSLCIADSETGEILEDYNSGKSLAPASVMKLVTSAVAIELLGPEYTFKTIIGYTGSLNKRSGQLTGNIIIKGFGDPALGSANFSEHYKDFIGKWIDDIKKAGIRTISGRVVTDDSYFDFLPFHAKWLWEDSGVSYGAGIYGLSVFDNTYEIHMESTTDSARLNITGVVPAECKYDFSNLMTATGATDNSRIFAAPYSTKVVIGGTGPANNKDFVLKASITDPPILIAKIVNERLNAEGIKVSKEPTTTRLEPVYFHQDIVPVSETISPTLARIINVLNHESVNLYAEHLTKELGKVYKNNGSTASGIEVIRSFLDNAGINTKGMFIEDGSGLSPQNSINSKELVNLLIYMKKNGRYFSEYYSSLPETGKLGTLKNNFKDPVFDSNLRAKSGSMTRVRSYAGYFTALSGRKLVFSILVNDYTGPSTNVSFIIKEFLKEMILTK